jgi:hypothetical protein
VVLQCCVLFKHRVLSGGNDEQVRIVSDEHVRIVSSSQYFRHGVLCQDIVSYFMAQDIVSHLIAQESVSLVALLACRL